MTSIGGYFELELLSNEAYHKGALALNTGRNCLEYVLRSRGYKKVYLPYYSCEVLLEPFNKLGVEYSFYHLNGSLELDRLVSLQDGEALLYINYFGLKQDYVTSLTATYGEQLIVDNTQAFYAKPIEGIDTFYSCRKFFGVADGAYLYCLQPLDMELEQDQSWARMEYLLKRIDVSPEVAYADFRTQSKLLNNNPIKRMSSLTDRIMASIDYAGVAERRRINFKQLDEAIGHINGIKWNLTDDAVPMVYPFLTEDVDLRQRLIDNKIYVAQYWPNVLQWCTPADSAHKLTQCLLPLPIDQRYGEHEMNRIIQTI
ncbi:MAG: hypothetical protein IKW97_04985 [Muribaculaceae bacterium]|nr:hypothetical protein [Muribaculaceae bacterium]